jgi:ribosome-binding protein aMBF1 (putative translation factor)
MRRKYPSFEEDLQEQLQNPEFSAAFKEAKRELEFATSLIHARELRGLTQTALAERLNSKQPMVARWEKGQVPQVPSLKALAHVLNAKIVITPNEKILIETL